jgi:hypothetical protein
VGQLLIQLRNLLSEIGAPGIENEQSSLRGNLLFKQGIGQLEALMFIGAGIEEYQRVGAETFDLADVVLAKAVPLVQSARVCEEHGACPLY